MLVGRDAELRELEGAAAEALRTGRGWTALVLGEPGIGKTALAAEFAARSRAAGVATAWAACRQEGGTPPYWPWAQLLDRLGRAGALTVADGDAELARFLLFDAVAAALRAAAPVLLVLDDLHWADPDSLRLLAALRAHVGEAPVLVLGTYRDTEPGGMATLAADRRIVLAGLAAADLGTALRAATGEEVDDAATATLHRRTGGNPFFAAEIVRMLRAGDAAAVTALPSGVRAVLERRLGLLDGPVRRILRAAAVLDAGTTAGVDAVLLAAVADVPVGALAGALVPAVEARLLVVHEGRHRFPHALVAETLRASTPPAEALALHRRAATALAARLDAAAGVPAELARH
ncbi:AAA family ATPase, partial [Pseudonocardia kujensis]|uniref:AAA family ATPase n=1 Tax=Pseudonocardia kujensis TaxID=1128675 RepID=UPI001E55DC57